jgi:hypothetical protein
MSVNTDPTALVPPDDEFLLWVIEDADLGPGLAVCRTAALPCRPIE